LAETPAATTKAQINVNKRGGSTLAKCERRLGGGIRRIDGGLADLVARSETASPLLTYPYAGIH